MGMLLNKIVLKTGEEFIGIIDYISSKQIYFFDFTSNYYVTEDIIILAMMWRGNALDSTRFSVYCASALPGIQLPQAKLIAISNIEHCDIPLCPTPKAKQRKRKIRNIQLSTVQKNQKVTNNVPRV